MLEHSFVNMIQANLYPGIGRPTASELDINHIADDIGSSFHKGVHYLCCPLLETEHEVNNEVSISLVPGGMCDSDLFGSVVDRISYSRVSWFIQIVCPGTKRCIRISYGIPAQLAFFELIDDIEFVDKEGPGSVLLKKGTSVQIGSIPVTSLPLARVSLFFQTFLVHGINDPHETATQEIVFH